MIYRSFLLLLLILAIFANVKAQSIQIGLRLENNVVNIKGNNNSALKGNPYSIQLNSSISLQKCLALELRGSIIPFLDSYSGYEIGAMIKYYYYNPLYVIGGVINHHTIADENRDNGTFAGTYYFPAFGIGFNPFAPSKHESTRLKFDVELMYIPTGKINVGWVQIDNNKRGDVFINNAFKIGAGFSFIF